MHEVASGLAEGAPPEVYLALLVVGSAVLATIYLWKLYLEDPRRPRGWWLQTVAIAATIKTIVGTYFGALVLYRWLVDLTLPASLRAFSTLGVIVLLLAPVTYALRAFLKRRKARRRLERLVREGHTSLDDLLKEEDSYALEDSRPPPES